MKNIRVILLLTIYLIFYKSDISYSQITFEWVKTYSSPELNAQIAYDVVTDTSGNVYVTGATSRGNDNRDLVTIKYDPAGNYLWGRNYDSPAYDYSNEAGYSAALYRNGSKTFIYCAGVMTYGTNNNIIVLKYDENGNQIWVKNFSYAGTGYLNQIPKVMSDAAGNCYVAGGSEENPYVVKYDSAGTVIFGTVIPRPAGYTRSGSGDMAFDALGNIYITGNCDSTGTNTVNYFTSKLNSAGVLQWSKIFRGAVNYQSRARKIAVGTSGNVYVTGEYQSGTVDYLTIKYNPVTGDTIWTRKFNGTAGVSDVGKLLALDASENIYVSGNTNYSGYGDIATVKYNSSGVQQWVKTYAGPGGYLDDPKDMIIDNSGNIFITGISDNSYFGKYVTLKYNPNGDALWIKDYDFAAGDFETPYAITLDKSGNVIVTGSSGYENISEFGTIKYNSSGVQQWAKRFYGAQLINDVSNEIVTDKNGNVYTVGTSRTNSGNNITVVKYNSAGVQKWVYNRGGGGVTGYDVRDEGNAIVVDTSGNVYFTGTWYYWANSKNDVCTGKLDSNGNSIWFTVLNGSGFEYGDDEGTDIALDKTGNVYISGKIITAGDNINYLTAKFNNAGTALWTRSYNGTANDSDIANNLSLDTAGNVYVTGNSKGAGSGFDITTIKYSSAGMQQWVARYNGTASGNDKGNCISTDDSGNVFVAGSAYNTVTGSDLILLKYKNAGTLDFVKTYSRKDDAPEEVFTSMIIQNTPVFRIYLAGNSCKANSNDITAVLGVYATHVLIVQFTDGYDIEGSVETKAYGLAVSNHDFYTSKKLYMTGITKNNLNNADIFTKEYRANGPYLKWTGVYNGISNGNEDQGPGLRPHVAIDNNGKVYVAGSSFDSLKGSEIAVMKIYSEPFQLYLEAFIEATYYQFGGERFITPDTVKVYLRNNSSPYSIADSAKGMLDKYGNGIFYFSNAANGGSYYISVKHRNSLETWSYEPKIINNEFKSFTFKDALGSAYGNNMATVNSDDYDFGFYSGDVNQDGFIDLTDVILIINDANSFVTGYKVTDLTGNNITDLTDALFAYNNSVKFVSLVRP